MLAICLTATLHSQRRALSRVDGSQKAQYLAERALAQLQTGTATPSLGQPETEVKVEPLKEASAPPQQTWVRVVVQHQDSRAELTGLVPTRVLEGKP